MRAGPRVTGFPGGADRCRQSLRLDRPQRPSRGPRSLSCDASCTRRSSRLTTREETREIPRSGVCRLPGRADHLCVRQRGPPQDFSLLFRAKASGAPPGASFSQPARLRARAAARTCSTASLRVDAERAEEVDGRRADLADDDAEWDGRARLERERRVAGGRECGLDRLRSARPSSSSRSSQFAASREAAHRVRDPGRHRRLPSRSPRAPRARAHGRCGRRGRRAAPLPHSAPPRRASASTSGREARRLLGLRKLLPQAVGVVARRARPCEQPLGGGVVAVGQRHRDALEHALQLREEGRGDCAVRSVSGLRGTAASTARPTRPPTSASTKRVGTAWVRRQRRHEHGRRRRLRDDERAAAEQDRRGHREYDDERDLRRARPDRRDQQVADRDPEATPITISTARLAAPAGHEAEHDRRRDRREERARVVEHVVRDRPGDARCGGRLEHRHARRAQLVHAAGAAPRRRARAQAVVRRLAGSAPSAALCVRAPRPAFWEDRPREPPRVHVTGPCPPRSTTALREHFELVDDAAGADGILVAADDDRRRRVPRPRRPALKVVANYGVGVNNIDLAAARERGVVVANTPDVLTRATAELAITLTLVAAAARDRGRPHAPRRAGRGASRSSSCSARASRASASASSAPGRIGRETARLAEAFGATALFAGRATRSSALLAEADVVSLHCRSRPRRTT